MAEKSSMKLEVIKESWNKYRLADNTILKIRIMLKGVRRTIRGGLIEYEIDTENHTIVQPDPSLRGVANPNQISDDEILRNVEIEYVCFDILKQESNVYLVDDNTQMKIRLNVSRKSRSSLKDEKGNPRYHVTSSNSIWLK